MKNYIITFVFSLFYMSTLGQNPENIYSQYELSDNRNYISTLTYNGTDIPVCDVQYFDGLGRLSQTIQVGHRDKSGSIEEYDLVTPYRSDLRNRTDAISFLPFINLSPEIGKYCDNDSLKQNNYYSLKYAIAGPYAFSEKKYKSIFDNEIYEHYNVGKIYRDSALKSRIYSDINTVTDSVACIYDNGVEFRVGYYRPGALIKESITDEDMKMTSRFKDLDGKTILLRQADSHINYDTYYIYDIKDRVTAVIPPEASRCFINSSSPISHTNEVVDRFCYTYKYDGYNNLIEKKLPGAEPERYVYGLTVTTRNKKPTAIQDGNLRESGSWRNLSYDYKYDKTKEEILTMDIKAIIGDGIPLRKQFSSWYDLYSSYDLYWYDWKTMEENYYGTTYASRPLEFIDIEGVVSVVDKDNRNSGLLTTQHLYFTDKNLSTKIERRYYYDYKGRIIQTVELHPNGAVSRYSTKYDFIGNKLTTHECHTLNGTTDVLVTNNTYDKRGRLLTTSSRLNSSAPATVLYSYNELGQLASKTVGNGSATKNETYQYNIQGWLSEQNSDFFKSKLHYYDPMPGVSPSYTGNITEWEWQQQQNTPNKYTFAYDSFSRLSDSHHYVDGLLSDTFTEKDIAYDANGNILNLKRFSAGTAQDDFEYSYNGNALTTLTNGIDNYSYTYDSNGNMIHDGLNNLDLVYNHLNRIAKVEQNGTTLANYRYLADGTKLSAIGADNTGYEYWGSLAYRRAGNNLSLESAAFPGGRITASKGSDGTSYTPYYYITDHLGSTRVIVNGMNEQPVEQNNYYPFGGRWNDNTEKFTDNRYLFNGKEKQDFVDVPYLDYGARMYDSRLGRFFNQDRYCEKYIDRSPYQYAANNPIKFMEINGDSLGMSCSKAMILTLLYNCTPPELDVTFKITNGVLDPNSFANAAANSGDFFLQDLHEIATNAKMVELGSADSFSYLTEAGELRTEKFEQPVDTDTKDEDLGAKISRLTLKEPEGVSLVGNLGQTKFPGAASLSGKRSTNNNIQVVINSLGTIRHQGVGLADEFGHVLLYMRGLPHGHDSFEANKFIDQRTNAMKKRFGYDF